MKKYYFASISATDKDGNSCFGNIGFSRENGIRNINELRDVEKVLRENGHYRSLAIMSVQKFPI